MTVSIIIPTLNEAAGIEATLAAVGRLQGRFEVIVADGGSQDATADLVRQRAVSVIEAPRGRGSQMHAGSRAAQGEVLWFLHADTHPPEDALAAIGAALTDPTTVAGHFALQFDGERRASRLLTWVYPRLRYLGLCYGDSGIFVRRSIYERVGGFQPYPIFEDLDLLGRLRRQGRVVRLPVAVVTSSRRFEGRSFTLTFAWWTVLQLLYWMGVSPLTLGRLYAQIRSARIRPHRRQAAPFVPPGEPPV